MGNVTAGRNANPSLLKRLIETTFQGVTTEPALAKATPLFFEALRHHKIAWKASHKDVAPQIVLHKTLGVVVDGYTFTFAATAKEIHEAGR